MEFKKAKQQVDERNSIRMKAGLPLLDPEQEIAKIIETNAIDDYQKFYDENQILAREIILKNRLAANPDYKIDSFMKAVSLGVAVRNLVREWWNEKYVQRV